MEGEGRGGGGGAGEGDWELLVGAGGGVLGSEGWVGRAGESDIVGEEGRLVYRANP